MMIGAGGRNRDVSVQKDYLLGLLNQIQTLLFTTRP